MIVIVQNVLDLDLSGIVYDDVDGLISSIVHHFDEVVYVASDDEGRTQYFALGKGTNEERTEAWVQWRRAQYGKNEVTTQEMEDDYGTVPQHWEPI